MVKNQKRGQSLSTDVLVVVVLVLFSALFLVVNKITEEESEDLDARAQEASAESRLIVEKLRKDQIIDSQNNIDVNLLLSLDDQAIKEELNLKNDFAIVFEKDGRLVQIDPENGINCVGTEKIVVNDVECK